MLSALLRFSVLVFLMLSSLLSLEASAQPPALDCSTGPVTRTYGSTPWLVYACSDGKSVVAVTSPGSPAAPFYFMLFQKDGKYTVVGEGTGAKSHTDRAYAELTHLTEKDVADLLLAAKQVKKPPESSVEAQKLGEDSYRLVLKTYRSNSVGQAQEELLAKARETCAGKNMQFGRYEYESSSALSAGAEPLPFVLKQEIKCDYASVPSLATAPPAADQLGPWRPAPGEEETVKRQTLAYLAAKDARQYDKAYAMFSPSQKRTAPFANLTSRAEKFNDSAGALKDRTIKKITWYRDPPGVAPGIYAAVDHAGEYDNMPVYCGYLGWQRQNDGSFLIAHEEEGFLDKATQQKIKPENMKEIRKQLRCVE